jgi:hypothetical protein
LVLRTARCPAQRPPSPQRHERDRRSGIQQRREGHWKLPEGLIEGLMKPIPSRTPRVDAPHQCNKYLHLSLQCQVQTVRRPAVAISGRHALPRPSPVRAPIKLLIAVTAPNSERLDAGKNANEIQRVAGTAFLFYSFR